jgi:hypothetical protein
VRFKAIFMVSAAISLGLVAAPTKNHLLVMRAHLTSIAELVWIMKKNNEIAEQAALSGLTGNWRFDYV